MRRNSSAHKTNYNSNIGTNKLVIREIQRHESEGAKSNPTTSVRRLPSVYFVTLHQLLYLRNVGIYRSNVELNTKPQGQCRAQIEKLFYKVLCQPFLIFYYLMAAFELQKLEILCKINSDKSVGIHNNNLVCSSLNERLYDG